MRTCLRLFIVGVAVLRAQPPALTLTQAVEKSIQTYPSIQVSQEQISAAAAAIQLARTAYLPKIDGLMQFNRATRNNTFGLLLPQSTIPSMSGPVIQSNNFGTVWGSAIGALVTWEPFDFGLRRANVAIANASRTQTEAAKKKSEFDVAVAATDAYLTLVAAQDAAKAAQAGVDRAQTIVRTITAQVNAELRPGADQSRAEAELAAARTQVIQAQQAIEVARASLAQFVGGDPAQVQVTESAALAQLPPGAEPAPVNTAANPIVVEQTAAVDYARAQLRALERTYFPKFYLQGAAYARGSGADLNGKREGALNGLGPDTQNYALGLTITFPVMDIAGIRAREAAQNATIRAQSARSQQLAVELRAQWNRAVAVLNGARNVAANTPVQVTAARAAARQATARYQAGLGDIDPVAEAQRLLTQAEIDDTLARLNVWRALLQVATAAGDIQPFLAEASR